MNTKQEDVIIELTEDQANVILSLIADITIAFNPSIAAEIQESSFISLYNSQSKFCDIYNYLSIKLGKPYRMAEFSNVSKKENNK